MKRKLMGVVIMIFAIALIAIAKISNVPSVVTVLLVLIALAMVLFGLTRFIEPSAASESKTES